MSADPQHVRMAEALLFAAVEPLDEETLVARLPEGADVPAVIAELKHHYSQRGVQLMKTDGRYSFVTAPDLGHLLQQHREVARKLSRAAVETLAIIAYHQPVTRAEIEEIRGVAISKGTLDVLLEVGWVRMRGRRRTPGRPVTYGTTDQFLLHFALESLQDLPGIEELKAAGLLEATVRAENLFGPPPGHSLPGQGEDTEDALDDEENEPLVDFTPPPEGEDDPPRRPSLDYGDDDLSADRAEEEERAPSADDPDATTDAVDEEPEPEQPGEDEAEEPAIRRG